MYSIDEKNEVISTPDGDFDIYSAEAFKIIEKLWVKVGWANKYSYQFTWLGRPIIQLPEDMIKTQEMIFLIKPTLIIETGVAHGGSLIFYASLLKLLGTGKVIGIDIEIKKHNRDAILSHNLSSGIQLIEGSSVSDTVISEVEASINKEDKVLVLLDSNHTYAHVLEELKRYANMVTVGSYIVATDGVMKDLVSAPGSQKDWYLNNPQQAVQEFLSENDNFVLDNSLSIFDESKVHSVPTYWPNAWLRRVK